MFLVNFFIFRQTRVFRITYFLLFKPYLVASSLICRTWKSGSVDFMYLRSIFIKRYLIYTITTTSQSALNIILGTWNIFYNLLQKLKPTTFGFKLKIQAVVHMTDIPIINYSTKFFLQQELSLDNRLNSLSLMFIIILLTIYLIQL